MTGACGVGGEHGDVHRLVAVDFHSVARLSLRPWRVGRKELRN